MADFAKMAACGERAMPINQLLKDSRINRDDVELLAAAFRLALRELQLLDRNDAVCDIVARKVIETAKYGARDPQEIADRAVKQLAFSASRLQRR
jgi:hypothetical protein